MSNEQIAQFKKALLDGMPVDGIVKVIRHLELVCMKKGGSDDELNTLGV